jgi:transposase
VVPSYVELAALVTKSQVTVAELKSRVAELVEMVAVRDARIADLEKLLEQSRRSGKRQAAPFSKGEPKAQPARPGRKSGKAHGRHGHRMAPREVDWEFDAPAPEVCPHCGGQTDLEGIAEQYQTDLPEPRPVTTKFKVHLRRCRDCGRRVQGRHPEQTSDALGAAAAQVGPGVKALAALLHYGMGLSFGRVAQLMARWAVPVTAGALCQTCQTTGAALEPTTAAIKASLAAAEQVTMDETGWKISGSSAWLWAATSTDMTLFMVADGRGFDEACLLVPADYHGVLVRDGWGPYHGYTNAIHQTCAAHLLRRCHEMTQDLPSWARSTPRRVAGLLSQALDARDLPARKRQAALVDIGELFDLLIEQPQAHEANRRLIKHLANERYALLTFLAYPGIDATNWRGEQAIRPGVVNRKTSGGNRSDRGAVAQGRIMSLLRTAHQQGANAVALLVDLARAPTPYPVPLAYPGVTL